MLNKRFPPFGRRLEEIRNKGMIPAKRVIVTTDWSVGKIFPRIIIAPDVPASDLQLRYLSGLHVQVAYYDRDAAILPGLITEILTAKPATLSVFSMSAAIRGEPAFHVIHRSQSIREAA